MRNTTHLWVFLILTLGIRAAYGQTNDSTAYTYEALPDVLFPTGLLHDQSSIGLFTEGTSRALANFDGRIPSNVVHRSDFEWLYQDLYSSQRLNAQGKLFGTLPAHVEPLDDYLIKEQNELSRIDVPIYLNWLEYNELDSNALENGWLAYDNDQFQLLSNKLLYGTNQVPASLSNLSPLDSAHKAVHTRTAFIAGSNADGQYIPGTSAQIDFSLRSVLVQSNINLPSTFDLDLGDGQGFRTVGLNDVVTATISTNSISTETVKHQVRVRARSGQHTLESTFEIALIFNAKVADQEILSSTLSYPSCYQGKPMTKDAKISIKYADKQLGLQKPMVLVEGFESALNPYGVLTYEGLASGAIVNKDGDPIYTWMEKLSWLFDSLTTSGYDVIFVDFEESKVSISENMQHVIKVLKWVDDQQPDEPAVLVGASMGGLISRVALNELADAGCCVNVRAYGTFDSPHDGAFIPIGLQAAAKRFGEMLSLIPSKQAWDKALNTPAAREMLLEHYNPAAVTDRANLLDWLGEEQPQGIRRFAISNGSDMRLRGAMKDVDHRFLHWGWDKNVVYKQHLGSSKDTLDFNSRGGQKRSLKQVGANVDAHQSNSDYLYEGRRWLSSPLAFRRMKWCNGWGARTAQIVVKHGPTFGWSAAGIDSKVNRIQKETNTALQKLRDNLSKQGLQVLKSDYKYAYAELPGGTTNTPEGFASFMTTIASPSHSFIPTFSALNVGPAWGMQQIRGHMDIIPFHSYMAPGLIQDQFGVNQAHIYTDEDIIKFCLNTLRSLETYIAPTGVLKQDYNIAKEHNTWSAYPSELRSFKIPAQRTLNVACSGTVGPFNGPIPADPAQNLAVFLGTPCGSHTIEVGGVLRLGDSPSRQANCVVRAGSTLKILSGGQIIIGPSSRLRIAKGAKLVLEPNSTVIWDEGTIEIEGELDLNQGAHFTPQGSGTLVANGASIHQNGGGIFQLIDSKLQLLDSLEIPVSTSLFDLNRCEIDVENHSTLVIQAPSQIFNTDVRAVGQKLGPTLVLSSASNQLEHNRFESGNPSLRLDQGASLALENSSFINADVGLEALGTLQNLYANSFFNCNSGAEISSPTFKAELNSFYSCSSGLKHLASSGDAELVRNEFATNATVGALFSGANVRMDCNDISYNTIGIQLAGGQLNIGANAGNTFNTNTIAIQFHQVDNLFLDHGHNTFNQSTVYDIEGTLTSSAPVANNGAFSYVGANYNDFSFTGSTDILQGRTKVHPFKQTNASPSPYLCPAKGTGKAVEPSLELVADSVQFMLFPNPGTSANFTAQFPAVTTTAEIQVYGSGGQLVHKTAVQAGQHRAQIHFNGQSGAYIVRFVSDEHTFTKRWILAP